MIYLVRYWNLCHVINLNLLVKRDSQLREVSCSLLLGLWVAFNVGWCHMGKL